MISKRKDSVTRNRLKYAAFDLLLRISWIMILNDSRILYMILHIKLGSILEITIKPSLPHLDSDWHTAVTTFAEFATFRRLKPTPPCSFSDFSQTWLHNNYCQSVRFVSTFQEYHDLSCRNSNLVRAIWVNISEKFKRYLCNSNDCVGSWLYI